jgi:Tfp pilus assembly protein PilF
MRHASKWLLIAALLIPVAAASKSVETTSGIIYIQNKQYEEARVILLKAIAKDPKDGEAQFYLGFAYSALDSVGLAYRHYMKAKELEPKKARDIATNIQSNYAKHYTAGQNAFKQANLTEAAIQFELATQADPTQSAGHYNLAVMYSRLAMTDSTYDARALAEADQVLQLAPLSDPNYTKALQLASRMLAQLGREEEAVDRFRPLIEKDPSKYPLVEQVGMELLKAKKWKAAEDFLKMAAEASTKLGVDSSAVYSNLGIAAFNQHRENPSKVDEAIAYYEKAVTLQPDDAPTVFNLIVANMAKQDWVAAAGWGEKYVGINPGDPKGWQYLARCYSEAGDTDKASDALRRYQELKG